MSKRKAKGKLNICPICKGETFNYISYSEYGWGIVEQHGHCDRCGYHIEQAYSPEMEFFMDIKKGFKMRNGTYVPKDIKRHKRIRKKIGIKGYDLNPSLVFYF